MSAPTMRAAFEEIAAGQRLSPGLRAETLRMFDHGRDDQIATWAQDLDGDPLGDADRRGTGHARGLADEVRAAIAAARATRDASSRRTAA